jgi:hypothetical protein
MKRPLLLSVLLLALPTLALGWGEKGHLMVNEAATLALPTDMPHFFYEAFPDLIWLGPDPDRWRNGGPSLEALNPPDHFLDYEYVDELELPPSRYQYIAKMHESGLLRRQGINNDDPGFLPWAIAENTEKIEVLFREWRAARPEFGEREKIERDIVHFAGVLGHYVGDSANPHHTTTNYNGWVEATNPNGYAIDCGTHSRFESGFVSHAVELSDIVPQVAAPQLHTDYFATALAQVRASNALVETLYRIDRDGGFHPIGKPPAEGMAFATSRLANGASLLRDLWWSAWVNSAKKRER